MFAEIFKYIKYILYLNVLLYYLVGTVTTGGQRYGHGATGPW